MANINSKTEARKKVREAQARANEARLQRERQNVDDAASFLVELGRLAAVDEWEQGRVVEIRAEGERRRHEHRQAGAAAVSRMLDRGETLTAIAELAGVKVSDVRAVLKSTGAQPVAAPDALGAADSASAAPDSRGVARSGCAQAVVRPEERARQPSTAAGVGAAGCGHLKMLEDPPRMTVSSPFVLPAVMNALSVNRWQHGFGEHSQGGPPTAPIAVDAIGHYRRFLSFRCNED